MHKCKLENILTDEEIVILGEVVSEAHESSTETLRLHEADNPLGEFPDNVETYLALIELQKKRIDVLQKIYGMLEGG